MRSGWICKRVILDGEPYDISGLNIWEHTWKDTGRTIVTQDPLYGQTYTVPVYEIAAGGVSARFATTEFSNGVWGVYEEA